MVYTSDRFVILDPDRRLKNLKRRCELRAVESKYVFKAA